MARGVKLTKDKVAQMIVKKAGNISEVADAMKVSRTTVYNKINKHEDLSRLLTETRNSLIDCAESQLIKGINEGDPMLIIFVLKEYSKNRGY